MLVTGNPKYTATPQAKAFYKQIEKHLTGMGYQVTRDPGEDYTMPSAADLWVGHSRGAERFRFAPKGQKYVALGSNLPGAINHPDDKAFSAGTDPDDTHFTFTPDMAGALTGNKQAAGMHFNSPIGKVFKSPEEEEDKPGLGENLLGYGGAGLLAGGAAAHAFGHHFLNPQEIGAINNFGNLNPDVSDYRKFLSDYVQAGPAAARVRPAGVLDVPNTIYAARGGAHTEAVLGEKGMQGAGLAGWMPDTINHYREMAKGPLYGYMQMQREVNDPNPHHRLRGQPLDALDTLNTEGLNGDTAKIHKLIGGANAPVESTQALLNTIRPGAPTTPSFVDRVNHLSWNPSSAQSLGMDPASYADFRLPPDKYQQAYEQQLGQFLQTKGFKPQAAPSAESSLATTLLPPNPRMSAMPAPGPTFSNLYPGIPETEQMKLLSEFNTGLQKTRPGMAFRQNVSDLALGKSIKNAPAMYKGYGDMVGKAMDVAKSVAAPAMIAGGTALVGWAIARARRQKKQREAGWDARLAAREQ